MIYGVDRILIAVPVALLILAALYFLAKRGDPGTGSGVASFAKIVLSGGFILIILFIIWESLYYVWGGH